MAMKREIRGCVGFALAVLLTGCGATNAGVVSSPPSSTAGSVNQQLISPSPQQLSNLAKGAGTGVNQWLQMFKSTQTSADPYGSTYKRTATINIIDISKVGGHVMTAGDLVSGAASSQTDFIKATLLVQDNAPAGDSYHHPDFTSTVELKQISVLIGQSDDLSPADLANGITYRGTVSLAFIGRYTAPNGSTPLAYKDDGYQFGLVVQNGQPQITPISFYWIWDEATRSGGAEIVYPAEVFERADLCNRYPDSANCP